MTHVHAGGHVDVVLIHVPRSAEVLPRVFLMPTGLVAIADYLDKRGHTARVVHAGVEAECSPQWDLAQHVRERAPKLVGFALSWHQQATDVMRQVQQLHGALPAVPIVLGGFTASRFAAEILRDHPEVSFVVHGDAELPMSSLLDALGDDVRLASVPNLVWRDRDGVVRENDARWQLDAASAPSIDFARFDLVDHHERVLEMRMDDRGPPGDRVFYFSPGRGCGATCCYCAGAKSSQKRYERRDEVVQFPVEHVVSTLVSIEKRGVNRWNACFDPDPASRYYLELFDALRARGTKLDLIFDCFGLPSQEFVEAFARTFGPGSALNVSPETGSDALRRKLRTFFYTNEELFERLAQIDALGLKSSMYFATGLPRETRDDLAATLRLVRAIRQRHPRFWIHVGIIDIEPGSMLFDHPERLGVTSSITDFKSLLRAQEAPREVNYSTAEFSAEAIAQSRRLVQITAQCPIGGAPFEERLDEVVHAGDPLTVARGMCSACPHVVACYG